MTQHIILLHGLARTSRSMRKLAVALTQAGFSVDNCSYPSTRLTIEDLAEKTITEALQRRPDCDSIHFVTHSLGGIMLRYYLSQHDIDQLGRVVMLAPPNQGSEVVDHLKHWRLFRWFNGPAGQQLGTDKDAIASRLPPADFELGIIAGSRSINWYLSTLLPGQNDGKVSIEATKLSHMTDYLILPVSHPFIMNNKLAIRQTIHFLRDGKFKTRQLN